MITFPAMSAWLIFVFAAGFAWHMGAGLSSIFLSLTEAIFRNYIGVDTDDDPYA